MIPPITSLAALSDRVELTPVTQAPAVDFGKVVGEGLKTLNANLNASDEVLRGVAAGEPIPLHDVMIVMTRAQLSLQFAVAVRNRMVESYQQLFQMQV